MSQLDALPDYLVRVASRFYEGLGTPIALSAAIKLRYSDWEGLSQMWVDPRSYVDVSRYAADNAACTFFKKLEELPLKPGEDPDVLQARAKSKWWEGEHQCYRSNERLSGYTRKHRLNNATLNPDIDDFLSSVREIIVGWIGHAPPELTEGRHGPGATFSDKGRKSTVPDKMSRDPSLTSDAIWFLPQWLETKWGRNLAARQGKLSFIRGNRFTTVPKTSTIDRAIAVEPSINVFYQLGLGSALRRRLRNRAGWDMDVAQEVHRRIAKESSVTTEFATLDLSNASDTVSSALVEAVIPPGWFGVLDDLRSKFTLLDGHWVRLEKFSSMGNGFSFELETIIFAGLCCAVIRKNGGIGRLGVDCFVFGDDIIIPDNMVQNAIPVLRFCGLSLNSQKSYWGGVPFRESCGGDFFAGQPVRGYYLKNVAANPMDVIASANGLSALNDRLACYMPVSWWAHRHLIESALPTSYRLWGPKALGDSVLWTDDETRWRTRTRWCVRYVKAVKVITRLTPYDRFDADTVLACATYGLGNTTTSATRPLREGFVARGGVSGFKVGLIPFS